MLPSLTGPEFVAALLDLRVTHVVWLPDSITGRWERELEASSIELVRVCREGEAWALAAGLHLGGALPLVVMQNTGLFESGDALRNILFDFRLPLYALIGCRSFLVEGSTDSARHFTLPILHAWELDYVLLDAQDPLPSLLRHFRKCQEAAQAGCALLPEGRN